MGFVLVFASVWSWDTAMDTIRSRSGDSTSVNAAIANIAYARGAVDVIGLNVDSVKAEVRAIRAWCDRVDSLIAVYDSDWVRTR